MDKWALVKLNELINKVANAYDNYEFHQVYHSVRNFCVVDMSNFYLDVLKDRLYTEKKESHSRRAAQTTIYIILDSLTRMIAPILAYTSDEIWKYIPHRASDDGEKCERCWEHSVTVGADPVHPTLCQRCVNVLK